MKLSVPFTNKLPFDRLQSMPAIGAPVLVLATLAMVVLPMPPLLLDMAFTFNIALALVVLLVTIYTRRPLDFAAFPTVLLIATLLRLALNVASTRVVLLHGHEGSDAAGQVIDAFGSVVIGGNYAVGLVVFVILMIINFMVVTKGAGRISEVSARFTLDAMPGKQMAIDADLNAGLIDQEQARTRRAEVTKEADFYGSMDGASKFVKGDAIAGILILFINIIGGLIIGMMQHQLGFAEAASIYSLLTIGDGLVAQIPSLLLSIAAAMMVTRQNTDEDMGKALYFQMFNNPQALMITGVILFVMGIVPGMPHIPFLLLALLIGAVAYWRITKEKQAAENNQSSSSSLPAELTPQQAPKELSWDDVQPVDMIGLEVGYRLISMVDKEQGGELLERIKGVRKKLSQDFGFLIPAVHIRDNLELPPNCYRISLMGVTCGEANIHPNMELAINPGQVYGNIDGEMTKDPAFGLDAVWVQESQREHAQALGYTVVDSSTVLATHLSQILTNNAAHLLGHEEVQNLLEMLGQSTPKLVDGFVPDQLPLGVVVKVMQNLLNEAIPLRDIRTIVQTLSEYSSKSQDPDILTAAVRIGLKRLICQEINGVEGELPVITLVPELEQILHKTMQSAGGESTGIEPGLAERLQQSLADATQQQEFKGEPAVLLTSGVLRSTLAKFVKNTIPTLRVLSYQEVPDEKQIRIVNAVGH
ncbi:TPA: flagellar biosynthesis protein FlhA [Photobacterium damselae]|uniref:Flagellar biosynthesis protein FlhA n=1 Tax=Photobacterium damselae TaxID=38293 RepID=A0ABD6X603_PHODM|nr:flagellar biosynthesis protein FlhA [Photobacterium damselae]EJN6960034.1 flagellar biosynthesis protein FlhA [Photobacterium damselae]KAB1509907.1 flagellar biosynthesis protein FlhA [Photobacterium damselae subsp. damselae]MCG3843881.1 flagellar biosynthesis protein FlhA [Photobacterium damselae]MCG9776847.1 flagellar biosynthesis protein FlhA [Photobacterium damselae]OBU46209.1 flagellar biosynthesis protein FlhA [Photobacterium damselae]